MRKTDLDINTEIPNIEAYKILAIQVDFATNKYYIHTVFAFIFLIAAISLTTLWSSFLGFGSIYCFVKAGFENDTRGKLMSSMIELASQLGNQKE